MSHDSVQAVADALAKAKRFADVFGTLPKGGDQKRALKQSYRTLLKAVHPDKTLGSANPSAGLTLTALIECYRKAEAARARGTYDTEAAVHVAPTVFELAAHGRAYTFISTPCFEGDQASFFEGVSPTHGVQLIAKVAHAPPHNAALLREREAVEAVRSAQAHAARFLPEVFDAFSVAERGEERTVLVRSYRPSLVSVASILAKNPRGLAPEDAGWIARRVFAQAIAAHGSGYVHGAIVPEHVLVDPLSREPMHLGWSHALRNAPAARITHLVAARRSFYPPEVFARKRFTTASDIYMAGMSVLVLFGGDVSTRTLPRSLPESVCTCIRACVHDTPSRRPQDAREALDTFTRAIRAAWGKSYRPLVVGGA